MVRAEHALAGIAEAAAVMLVEGMSDQMALDARCPSWP
jgi:hypothetical protein